MAEAGRKQINPWVVALTVTIATFMELLDTSIANVALPHIAGGLGRSFDEVTWILTTYLVANAVILPMSAWLSRVFGRKTYYMLCVALFTVTSFFCGIAPSLNVILIARVLQGIAGGGLAPVEQSILVDTFPPAKRASAFALYTVAIVTAPAIGPVLGGWITDNFNWRWVFFINIPIGIASLLLTERFVHDPPAFEEERRKIKAAGGSKIDGVGIALIGIGSAALEIVLDRGQIDDWFGSTTICWLLAIAVTCWGTAIWWELRAPDPIVEFHMLANRNFAIACVFYFVFGVGLFATTTMIPQVLQSLYGYRAMDAGLVLGPGALVITFLAPVAAQLVQRGIVHPRVMIGVSLSVVGASMFYYSNLTLQTDYFHYAFARAYQGLGYAFLFVPLTVLAYSGLRPDQNNKASSLTNLFRNWGGSFGVAFVTTMSERRQNFHQERLGSNLTASGGALQQTVHQITSYLQAHGMSAADATSGAYAQVYAMLEAQTRMLGFMDCFRMMGWATLAVAPLVLLAKHFRAGGKAPAGH
ncbi:DHA2 family efflux MFS transporter permease subunit [Terriglobus tenax]|uniref:DHA2 family efflux MFS transporter permease subunit n=1 Tax=Terriglobus tenax TaxID=1111115 RepID=UPI0021E0A3F7|nr:DHA2 family efflux MFS transporter permease subunit [Terriglobus tenax]